MTAKHILHAGMVTLLFGTFIALAERPDVAPATTGHKEKTSAEAESAGIFIVEEDYYVIRDEPHTHLTAAARDAAAKDLEAAGAEMRKAGFFLRAEATGAEGDAKKALVASAHELGTVGKDLENGVVRTDKDIAYAISGAYASLAQEHYLRAAKKHAAGDWNEAKHELAAAADSVESHFKSAGTVMGDGTHRLIGECRKAAAATGEKADEAGAEVGRLVHRFGEEVKHLGTVMQHRD